MDQQIYFSIQDVQTEKAALAFLLFAYNFLGPNWQLHKCIAPLYISMLENSERGSRIGSFRLRPRLNGDEEPVNEDCDANCHLMLWILEDRCSKASFAPIVASDRSDRSDAVVPWLLHRVISIDLRRRERRHCLQFFTSSAVYGAERCREVTVMDEMTH